MDQLESTLLPLSSPSNTASSNSISNPDTGTAASTIAGTIRKPHSDDDGYRLITPFRRVATILSLLLLALWANYEASKGFDVTVVSAPSGTLAARRYNLFFVSNGRAAAMALESSSFIERIVYPDGEKFPRKHVRHVTIRLTDRNITGDVVVSYRDNNCAPVCSGEYLIEISSTVMTQKDDVKAVFASALHRGMAYVWLQDGHGTVPRPITDSLVEYLSLQYNLLPPRYHKLTHKTATIAALIIQKCEERNNGFVARLNNALQDTWNQHSVTDAFRNSPPDIMCLSHIVPVSEDQVLPDDPGLNSELDQAM